MAIRHRDDVLKVEAVRTVPEGDTFVFEIDVTTAGNIRKTLRVRHCDASNLASMITDETDAMPVEDRKRSFFASMRRKP